MSNQETLRKLREMRLGTMATACMNHLEDPAFRKMQFEDLFACIVEAEWIQRKNNRIALLIKNANLKYSQASMESIEYHEERKLNRDELLRLASCNYIRECQNIIIMGATGSGKSWLCCALGLVACRCRYTVKYVRLPELLDELKEARLNNHYRKVINQYMRPKLLIIDEWLLRPLGETDAGDVLEIIESRYQVSSTIFCSQYKIEGWHLKIDSTPLSEAILDRIKHNSYKILIEGKVSMRERKGLQDKPK